MTNELRIGNLVEYKITDSLDERKEWWELNPIDVFDLQHLVEFPEDGFFRPIPLTAEWLLKFEFEKEESGYWSIGKLRGALTVCRAERESGRLCYRWFVNNLKMTDLHFVHQLQNLYFALCGEELTIKQD